MGKYRLTNKNAIILLEKRLKMDLNVLDDKIFHEVEIIIHNQIINEQIDTEETYEHALSMINENVLNECKKLISFFTLIQDEQNVTLRDETLAQLNSIYQKEFLSFYDRVLETRYVHYMRDHLNEKHQVLSEKYREDNSIKEKLVSLMNEETDSVKKLNHERKQKKDLAKRKWIYSSVLTLFILLIGYLIIF